MINTDAWRFGDDPENDGPETCRCGKPVSEECVNAWNGASKCLECFEGGPDNDKDLDPESIGGYTYDIQAIKDTQEGT